LKFNFNKDKFLKRSYGVGDLPEGYCIRKIDAELFDKIQGTVVPFAYWENSERFIENGAGFCVMKGDAVISTAFSAFVSNSMIDIGIETNPNYRGIGLGAYAASEMIEYCLNYRYEPIWGTRNDNKASAELARKLGFDLVCEHPFLLHTNN
jgi:RimJ/RimL family protein N-acetyltransferase